MALSNSQYDSIMRIYNQKQLNNKHELDRRTKEVYERIPAIREMNDEISSAAVRSAKQLLNGDREAVEKLRKTIAGKNGRYCWRLTAILTTILRCIMNVRTAVIQDTVTAGNAIASASVKLTFCMPSPISGKY